MILTKEIVIKINAKNIEHYKSKGYNCILGKAIRIKTEDLTPGSHEKIEFLCDYCNKNTFFTVWKDYYKRKSPIKKDACCECKGKKTAESNLLTFGVENVFQIEEIKNKSKETCLEKYGVESYRKTKECQQKIEETNLIRYGSKSPMQNELVKQKLKNSFILKYGVDNPQKDKEIKLKTMKTLYQNNQAPSSKQQIYLNEIYKGILNYPLSNCFLDIYLDNIDIEYDGGGHNYQVKIKQLTEEEFKRKEQLREMTIRSHDIKIMRIISSLDKLPSKQKLLEMLEIAKQYFSENHSWIYFNIDENKIYNSLHQKGINFDFGELYTIS